MSALMPDLVLVTGATGNVGRELVPLLSARGVPVRAAVRDPSSAESVLGTAAGLELARLDFGEPATHAAALEGVARVFLVRPPDVADAAPFKSFVRTAKRLGVVQIVVLSVLGAERNPLLPHRRMERLVEREGIALTALRASFFMQNLSTVHRRDITERDEVFVPAGDGRTSFVDVRDIAAVAAVALTEPGHDDKAYDVTGSEALTYADVARELSAALGRDVRYPRPGVRAFARRMRAQGFELPYILTMIGIYTTARLGLAGRVSGDVEQVLGRPPISFGRFARGNAETFSPTGISPDRRH